MPKAGHPAVGRHRSGPTLVGVNQQPRNVSGGGKVKLDSRLDLLGGAAVLVGSIVAGIALTLTPHGYTDPLRPLASLTALGGAILVVLGAPVVFRRVWERSFVLGIAAYAGMMTTLLLFEVAAGAVEGTILPYLASHGGIPNRLPVALGALEKLALLTQLAGTICLAVAILRRRPYPWWLGISLLLSLPAGFLPLPIQLDGILVFGSLAIMGGMTMSGGRSVVETEAAPSNVRARA
jgi:hypothetical protein